MALHHNDVVGINTDGSVSCLERTPVGFIRQTPIGTHHKKGMEHNIEIYTNSQKKRPLASKHMLVCTDLPCTFYVASSDNGKGECTNRLDQTRDHTHYHKSKQQTPSFSIYGSK